MAQARRILQVRSESTWTIHPVVTVTLYQTDSGTHYAVYKERPDKEGPFNEDDAKTTTEKIKVDSAQVEDWFSRLSDLRIPAWPAHAMGCDGGFTELKLGGYSGKASYRWWSATPSGWEGLNAIANEIFALFAGGDECGQ